MDTRDQLEEKMCNAISETIAREYLNINNSGYSATERDIASKVSDAAIQFTIDVLKEIGNDLTNKWLTKSAKEIDVKISELQSLIKATIYNLGQTK